MLKRAVVLGVMLVLLAGGAAGSAQVAELRVLPEKIDGAASSAMMDAYLRRLTREAFARRTAEYEALKTPEQLADYQHRKRQFFLDQLGPFPERTPLNARTVGREQCDGYRLEKVIYESRPGFHVTALLYLPETPPPYPGVLFPCGHSENGKAEPTYQRACQLLARNGLAVLCFDPIGQGERKQILDAGGKSRFRATAEHSQVSTGAVLLGRNVASIEVWDGMRGIDYLQSRPEIDPKRIGCTGNSGGGTQTSYLMALDDRVVAAAPGCYLTTFQRLLETIGPQDPEQNIHGQIAAGLDHADFLMLHAPKPALMGVATRDFFDIGGAWDTFRQAKRFYTRLGFPERVDLAETDRTHGYTEELRVATTRWMRRWLLGKDDAVTETETPVMTDEQLQCTPKGQVMLMGDERSVLDLYREENSGLAEERRRLWAGDRSAALEHVRKTAGIRAVEAIPQPEVERVGEFRNGELTTRKLVLKTEDGVWLPALYTVIKPNRDTVALFFHGGGNETDHGLDGPFNRLLRDSGAVLSVDLRGLGETQARGPKGEPQGTSTQDLTLAYLLGKSYVGMRAEDVIRCAKLAGSGALAGAGKRRKVRVVAVGEAGVPALHAAALASGLIEHLRLHQSLRSWEDVLKSNTPGPTGVNQVHGALRLYDLPDLVKSLGDTALVTEPVDANGHAAR